MEKLQINLIGRYPHRNKKGHFITRLVNSCSHYAKLWCRIFPPHFELRCLNRILWSYINWKVFFFYDLLINMNTYWHNSQNSPIVLILQTMYNLPHLYCFNLPFRIEWAFIWLHFTVVTLLRCLLATYNVWEFSKSCTFFFEPPFEISFIFMRNPISQ